MVESAVGGRVIQTFPKFGRFEVVSAETYQDAGVFMLLYSRGGAGKTTLAAQLHESEADSPVVIFDGESGAKVVSDKPDIQVIPIRSWKDLDDLEEQIKRTNPLPWKTIILDNESEFFQLCINSVTSSDEDQVTQPEWGAVKRKMLAHIRFYRDLAAQRGINVILICWDIREQDETKRFVSELNFTPALQQTIPGVLDIIGFIGPVNNDENHRTLDFSFSPTTVSKFRRNTSSVARSIPLKMVYGVDNLPLIDIVNALKRGVEFPKQKYVVQRQNTPAQQSAS